MIEVEVFTDPPISPALAASPGRRAFSALRGLAAMLILIQCADLATTFAILEAGGREGNPASAHLLAVGGFVALGLTKAALSGVTVLSATALVCRGFGALARRAMVGVIVVHAAVITSNVHQLATNNW